MDIVHSCRLAELVTRLQNFKMTPLPDVGGSFEKKEESHRLW